MLFRRDDTRSAPAGTWTPILFYDKPHAVIRCPQCGRTIMLEPGAVESFCPYLRCSWDGTVELEGHDAAPRENR